jgi:hypothetical protein
VVAVADSRESAGLRVNMSHLVKFRAREGAHVPSVIEDVERVKERILSRIRELEAGVAELDELRALAARLGLLDDDGGDSDSSPASRAKTTGKLSSRRAHLGPRAYAAPTRAPRAGARTGRHGAPAGQPTRRDRVLNLVAEHPGISVRELVEALGVNRTSLYPVVRQLVSDGLLRKDGKGLKLTNRAGSATS